MSVKIHIDTKQALRYVNRKENQLNDKLIPKGLGKAALFLQGEIKQSIAGRKAEPRSVDTGRFLNTVAFDVGKKDAIIFSKLKYAKFLEYGSSRVRPRRHFRNSKDRNKKRISDILAKQIKTI